MSLGGGGGGGAEWQSDEVPPNGANGGGIVLLSARNLVITGVVNAKGQDGTTTRGNLFGGAGAGGSVFLRGESLNVGTSKMRATGGMGLTDPGLSLIHI